MRPLYAVANLIAQLLELLLVLSKQLVGCLFFSLRAGAKRHTLLVNSSRLCDGSVASKQAARLEVRSGNWTPVGCS